MKDDSNLAPAIPHGPAAAAAAAAASWTLFPHTGCKSAGASSVPFLDADCRIVAEVSSGPCLDDGCKTAGAAAEGTASLGGSLG